MEELSGVEQACGLGGRFGGWGKIMGRGSFLNIYFISSYVCMSMCGSMHVSADSWKVEASNHLQSEL